MKSISRFNKGRKKVAPKQKVVAGKKGVQEPKKPKDMIC